MLILFLLVFGLLAGWLAQLVLGRRDARNYAEDLVVGLAGSFLGGLLISLLAGDGLAIRPSGLIGSIVGAIILLAAKDAIDRRRRPVKQAQSKQSPNKAQTKQSHAKQQAKRRR